MSATLRPADAGDGAGCAAIYVPVVRDSPTSFEVDPPDAAEMARRISAAGPLYPWLVCVEDGEVLGYAYGGRHRARAAYGWSAEVSVYGHPDHHRRGIGRALYRALLEILTLQGFHRAFAGITLPNPGSVALHEGCGFEAVGVFHRVGFKAGAWHDVGWWERDLAPAGGSPSEPTPFADLVESDAVRARLRAAATHVRRRA